jgi:hypothetical protein
LSHAGSVSEPPKASRIVCNQLRVNDKAYFGRKAMDGRENKPMVNRLH